MPQSTNIAQAAIQIKNVATFSINNNERNELLIYHFCSCVASGDTPLSKRTINPRLHVNRRPSATLKSGQIVLALTSIWTTILLAAAVALGPLAVDMYLPALPQIGADFHAGTDQVQLTLSVYLAGFAIAQLICGPLADRFGRKPIMIGGFLLFT